MCKATDQRDAQIISLLWTSLLPFHGGDDLCFEVKCFDVLMSVAGLGHMMVTSFDAMWWLVLCHVAWCNAMSWWWAVLLQYYSVLQSTTPVLPCSTKCYSSTTLYYKVLLQYYPELQSTTLYYKVLLQYYLVLLQYYSNVLLRTTTYYSRSTLYYKYYSVYSSTTLYYKVLLKYYSVLQSTTPILLRTANTTLYYSSTTLYYKVLLQYYLVLQSITPVLTCTTKYYSSTNLYYKVVLQYYSVLQSTRPILLCTTKYYSNTTQYYKYYSVLLQYYPVLQSTTQVLLCTTPVLLCTTKYYSSITLYYKVLHDWSTSHMKRHLQCAERQASPCNLTKYCACHAKGMSWLIRITYETLFRMRGATGISLQPHQILGLPRKRNVMIDPHHIWNVIYNARSDRHHLATSPNTAPATQNCTPKSERNLRKTAEAPFPMRDRSEHIRPWSDHDPTTIRPWKCKTEPAASPRLLFALARSRFYWKLQRFPLRLSFQISPHAAPATKSDT